MLLQQTIGYGKSHDHLTNNRLAQLSQIRLDRFHTAVDGVIEKGLFSVKSSRHFDFRYQIANKFLKDCPQFFTPHLPKKRAPLSKTDDISEKKSVAPNFRDRHNITLTSFNLTTLTQQPAPQPLPVINNVTDNAEKPPQESCENIVVAIEDEKKDKHDPAVTLPTLPAESQPPQRPESTLLAVETAVENKQNTPVALPAIIEEKHYPACYHALNGLSSAQQQRVINTLENKQKSEVIYNATGLLIALSTAEREGRLVVPAKKKQPTHHRHPSHQSFNSPKHPCNQQQTTGLPDHFGKLDWLRSNAEREGTSMRALAKKVWLEDYLKDHKVVKRWLTFHAKQEEKSIDVLADELFPNSRQDYLSRHASVTNRSLE
jgi:hypothetical protein